MPDFYEDDGSDDAQGPVGGYKSEEAEQRGRDADAEYRNRLMRKYGTTDELSLHKNNRWRGLDC